MSSVQETRASSSTPVNLTASSNEEHPSPPPSGRPDSISSSQPVFYEGIPEGIKRAFQSIRKKLSDFFQFVLSRCYACCSRSSVTSQTTQASGSATADGSSRQRSSPTEDREGLSSIDSPSLIAARQPAENSGNLSRERLEEQMAALALRYVQEDINRIQQDTESTPLVQLLNLDQARRRLGPQGNAEARSLVVQLNTLEQHYVRVGLEALQREIDRLIRDFFPNGIEASLRSPVQFLNQEIINRRSEVLTSLRRRLGAASDPTLLQLADQIQANIQPFVRATTNRVYPEPSSPRICRIRPTRHRIDFLQDLRALNETPEDRQYSYRIGNAQIKISNGLLMHQMVNSLGSSTSEQELLTDDSITTRNLTHDNPQIIEELTSFQEVTPGTRLPAGQAIFTRGHALTRGEFHSSVIHTAAPSRSVQARFNALMTVRRDLARSTNLLNNCSPQLIEGNRVQITRLTSEAESLVSPQILHDSIYNTLVEAHEHGETSIAMMPFYDVRQVPELNNPDRSERTSSYDFKYCIRTDKGAQVIAQALRHFNQDFPNSPLREIRFICNGTNDLTPLYNVFRQTLTML